MKNKLKLFLAIFLTAILIFSVSCQLPQESGGTTEITLQTDEDGEYIIPENAVMLSVTGKDGEVIVENAVIEIDGKKTVFDVTSDILKEKKIAFAFSGSGEFSYVQGINGLFEFDYGGMSGWLYSVNGEFMGMSAGNIELSGGELVEWYYTLDLGDDLGANAGE